MRGGRIETRGLGRTHRKGGQDIHVLRGVDVGFDPGERVAIVGPSGSGKSTFLHAIGLLDRQHEGEVLIDGQSTGALTESELSRLRNTKVGFVFQAHHLLPEHTALGNVRIPVLVGGGSLASAEARARCLLDAVGLGHRLNHRPGELSGGEQQRVALARALVMGPSLLLADEPTGNLDPKTSASMLDLLFDVVEAWGTTVVVVTHSQDLAARFSRRLRLEDGRFVEEAT